MKKLNLILILSILILVIPLVSAEHNITGFVNDAKDGIFANDHSIVLWNPTNGIDDNLTDIIGPNGASGENNVFLFDCDMLNTPCNIGDELNLVVLNNGDDHNSNIASVIVSGASIDIVNNISLNSPPIVELNSPADFMNFSSKNINFNCSAKDLDSNLFDLTLFGNWSGSWQSNESRSISGNFSSQIFTRTFQDGNYKWSCQAKDNLSLFSYFSENFTFTVDTTPPNISEVSISSDNACGTLSTIEVNCSATDSISGVGNIIIESISPNLSRQNYSATYLSSNTYFAVIPVNKVGTWRFNCFANDSFGNLANKTSRNLSVLDSGLSELAINSSEIFFNNSNPIEFQPISVNVTIYNLGCAPANDVLVSLYRGDPDLGGIPLLNQTFSVNMFSNITIDLPWITETGETNIFILIDSNNTFTEINKTNNKANITINVTSWQIIYGNITEEKILSNALLANMSNWHNGSRQGNIFVTDKESIIDWSSLQAIGRNVLGNVSNNDFSDIDLLLNTTGFEDSVYNVYTDLGAPKNTATFKIDNKEIENVPIIISTNSSSFYTGILWDTSDDKGDNEYDIIDKEDLVFVTQINQSNPGSYGIYDYEIKFPVRLRSYNPTDQNDVLFYYDLI